MLQAAQWLPARPNTDTAIMLALAHTLYAENLYDRDFVAAQIYRTGERPAYSFVPPGIANYPGTARYRWMETPLDQRLNRLVQKEACGFPLAEGHVIH